ncbi:hypothetical protein Dimus_030841, partial [Dionaea muscipula]
SSSSSPTNLSPTLFFSSREGGNDDEPPVTFISLILSGSFTLFLFPHFSESFPSTSEAPSPSRAPSASRAQPSTVVPSNSASSSSHSCASSSSRVLHLPTSVTLHLRVLHPQHREGRWTAGKGARIRLQLGTGKT